MTILKTIIRFILILIFLGTLIFLSINIFKLIPKGINQLASATVSLGANEALNATNTNSELISENKIKEFERTPRVATTTTNGLNGNYVSDDEINNNDNISNKNSGNIIIKNTDTNTKISNNTTNNSANTYNNTNTRKVYKKTTTTNYYDNYIENNNSEPLLSNGRNIAIKYTSIGIIDKNTGNFIQTDRFNTNDTVAIKFRLQNNQNLNTDAFSIRVEMPAYNNADKIRVIDNISLSGLSSLVAEARFDGIDINNTPIIKIYADTNNNVNETNENDNSLFVNLNNITNNGFSGNNNNNNGNYSNNTQVNLQLISLEIGRMSGNTFYQNSNINYGEKLAIRARIKNTGGDYNNTTFNTRLLINDSQGSREFTTNNENIIRSNAERFIIFEIDNLNRGSLGISFYVDNNYNISESNENDNIQSISGYIN